MTNIDITKAIASIRTNKLSSNDGRSSLSTLETSRRLHTDLVAIRVKGKPQVCPERPSFFFTNYTMDITCPTTSVYWILRQRYSRVYENRKEILLAAKNDAKCSKGDKQLIRALMKPLQKFPKRRIGIDDDSIIRERSEGFSNYMTALFQVREACSVLLESLDEATATVLRRVIHRIEKAVEMPVLHKKEELKWRERMSRIETHQPLPEEDTTCSICLEDLLEDAPAYTNIRLNCSHAFHLECVSNWLTRHVTCPLCRVNV